MHVPKHTRVLERCALGSASRDNLIEETYELRVETCIEVRNEKSGIIYLKQEGFKHVRFFPNESSICAIVSLLMMIHVLNWTSSVTARKQY